ncbi:hypothetical protein HID58_087642 [Brassica napus]|uniref:Uncharacterized protein n=1 Tax=Brassica napus TaxID=3708 RepID=A0ABQ7XTX5_BRANA|nr:hypothetical protein HID58_087642 [Brassica napus]
MPSEAEEGEVSGEACEDPIAPASLKEVLPGDSSPASKSADHPALGKEGCSHNLAEDHDVVHGEPHIETHPEKEQFLMGFGDNQHSKKDAEDPFFLATEQAVTYGVHILSENINLTVTFVYGFNVVGERQALWNELVEISDTPALQNSTWTVLGDFNKILRLAHHSGYPSHVVDSSGMQEANEALQDAGLFEAQAKGTPFTWSNNNDQDPVSKRIDHTLVNQIWADHFRDSYADLLEPGQSDHSPCIVKVPSLRRQSRKPFKFCHHIIDHPDYSSADAAAWNPGSITGSAQFKLVRTMKMLKKDLRGINKRHFSGISERVKGQSAKVVGLQRQLLTQPNSALAGKEYMERDKLNLLLNAEQKFFRHRSRVRWAVVGDRNTSFYHNTGTQRNSRNHIHFLKDENDNFLGSTADIKAHSNIVYCTWKEHNARIFQQVSTSEVGVIANIHRLLRDRLISIHQPPSATSSLF